MNLYAVTMKVGGTIRTFWEKGCDETDAIERARWDANEYCAVLRVAFVRRLA